MTPTIGRIVHYRPEAEGAELRPAVITKVWGDTCVNLHVFGEDLAEPQGMFPTSVGFGETSARSWFWPPRV